MYSTIARDEFLLPRVAGEKKTILYFMASIPLYLMLLVFYYFTKLDAVRLVANVFAFSLFIMFLLAAVSGPRILKLGKTYSFAFFLIVAGMVCNAMINLQSTEWTDFVKMACAPIFFVIGYYSLTSVDPRGIPRSQMRNLTVAAMLIPLLILMGELLIWGDQFREEESISIFTNRNNAALYAVVLSIPLILINVKPILFLAYLILVAAAFGTLGVFLAVVLSIAYVHLSGRRFLVLLALGGISFFLIPLLPNIPVFDRLANLSEGIAYLYSSGELWNISQLSYGDLVVAMGGSSDVSFFFRLKHWTEIMEIFFDGSLWNMVFGYGVGMSVRETTLTLVPHNDYIRYLVECGVLPVLGFLMLNLKIIKDVGKCLAAIPFITIILYFFTENLINNFLAMMLFYFLAGFVVARQTHSARKRNQHEYSAD